MISENDFDFLFSRVRNTPIESRGYLWKVIADPTRKSNDPGLFYGRLFRVVDNRLS